MKPPVSADLSTLPDAPSESPYINEPPDDDEVLLAQATDILEPQSYKQALKSPDSPEWQKAMDDELQSLRENEVYEIVPRPRGQKIVDSRWVFKVKSNAEGNLERYKARLAAKGYLQTEGVDYDEIFSPIVRFNSL